MDPGATHSFITPTFASRIHTYIKPLDYDLHVGTPCNTPKYTLVVFDMFRVFCKHNLTVS